MKVFYGKHLEPTVYPLIAYNLGFSEIWLKFGDPRG